jgi:MoxR-like ATPase
VNDSQLAAPAWTAAGESGAAGQVARLERQIGRVVKGKPEAIRLAVVCLLALGHILIEDVPGVGKTTLAQTLARSLGLEFQRIQFTSDLLPSDIIGVSVYRDEDQRFEFVQGPIFANVVLADEINRASPKTQSALLEAMSERTVSVDRVRHILPDPFLVLATQNPLEYVGTFPLPESQLDRFMMSLRLGYPPREEELGLLRAGGVRGLLTEVQPVVERDDLIHLRRAAAGVEVAAKLAEYILDLTAATRNSPEILLGVSTRGAQNLYRATQAMALCEERGFAIPDDVQRVAPSVLSHRVALKGGAGGLDAAHGAIERILASTPVPV